ncbi:LacI family DNA-binding transcriptional regulator [Undibacterium sp. TJN19]|uniref:LacI family DNA-binding transcriptional regulator n=1 Tax=Undibacterium sp. TJN19 TaxID=3413055 RepID=UPI003BEFA817
MATIKDVARLAGVGLGTASRVVSGKGSVSVATQEKVRQAIAELDFRPSHAARSLLSGNSQMIGVYIPVLKGTFYMPILQSIDNELRAAGLHMVVAFGVGTGDERRQGVDGIEFLMERGCDGLIVMSNVLTDEDFDVLGTKRSRLVVLNHGSDNIAAQCFTADHVQGGIMAARALLDHHHKKIAVIAGPSTAPDNVDRINGFLGELASAGVNTADMWIAESDFSPEGGWNCAKELVESGRSFTAVFCANDEMALGALSYFQQAGIAVPRDVSVVGYDDTMSAAFAAPPLTSVHIPWRDVTLSALNELLNRCYGTERPVIRDYPITVTMRASLAKPGGQRRKGN